MSRSRKRKNNGNSNQSTEKVMMNIDNPLFDYINPRNNDKFSEMSGIDLQDLLYYMNNYYLELRNRLGFDNHITFGLELEFEDAKQKCIETQLRAMLLYDTWILKGDGSLHEGAEINSPILKDTSDSWKKLKEVCSIVNKNATIGEYSGGHIHIGTQVLGGQNESWLNFIKLWAVYENVIYRFVYGDFLVARTSMSEYARPMAKIFWSDYQRLSGYTQLSTVDIIEMISHVRRQAVNFYNVKGVKDFDNEEYRNTIEFRCPNGTIDPTIWQNNVNLFVNLLLYSRSSKYDDDIIQKRRNLNEEKYSSLDWYGELYLQQALELCDMLFTTNYDKVYFLRQYLKSFEANNKKLSKSKPFTKSLKI